MPPVNSQNLTAEKVHVWPRALAVAALLASTLAAIWLHLTAGNASGFWLAWWLPAVITASPLFAVRPKPFAFACLAAGVLLLLPAVVGVNLLGLWGAVILLLAATADPRRALGRARMSMLVGVLLAIVAGVTSAGAIYRALTSPPAGFIVHTTPEFTATEPAFKRAVQPGAIGYGVEDLSMARAHDDEGVSLTIWFRPDLSTDGQERLRQELTEVPGVAKVCLWYRDNHLRSRC